MQRPVAVFRFMRFEEWCFEPMRELELDTAHQVMFIDLIIYLLELDKLVTRHLLQLLIGWPVMLDRHILVFVIGSDSFWPV